LIFQIIFSDAWQGFGPAEESEYERSIPLKELFRVGNGERCMIMSTLKKHPCDVLLTGRTIEDIRMNAHS